MHDFSSLVRAVLILSSSVRNARVRAVSAVLLSPDWLFARAPLLRRPRYVVPSKVSFGLGG